MSMTVLGTVLKIGLVITPLLLGPLGVHAAGAIGPHAVVMVCSTIGSSGTNLLNLYVQGISSDDPKALSAVGTPTQPPPGIQCGAALANILSMVGMDHQPGGGANNVSRYVIQSVIPIEHAWVYTLIAP